MDCTCPKARMTRLQRGPLVSKALHKSFGVYPSSCSPNFTPYCGIQPLYTLYNPYIGGVCWYVSRVLSHGYPTFPFDCMSIFLFYIYDFPTKRQTPVPFHQSIQLSISNPIPLILRYIYLLYYTIKINHVGENTPASWESANRTFTLIKSGTHGTDGLGWLRLVKRSARSGSK